ncbi:MAG TPA: DUF1684 domain-containing protein [Candidatus Limnocylindrales bacterium]|nr:DUF1684 domain-containing protein [Candidatus Limnocylindrales bacterium]
MDRARVDAPRIAVTEAPPGFIQGDGSLADRLTLADWRRRIAALYAEVRAMAAQDPVVALGHWRAVRERLYREHPQSPVPAAERAAFRARHFEHDPALRFHAIAEPAAPPDPLAPTMELPNSGSDSLSFRRVGQVRLPFPDGERRLSVFWLAGYAGGLFIPFRDATNGTETYGAGRYLVDGAKSADLGVDAATGALVLDFNFATQPSCAFDPRWACPLAPPENRLDLPIRAGERLT